jgi:hypothetical protein
MGRTPGRHRRQEELEVEHRASVPADELGAAPSPEAAAALIADRSAGHPANLPRTVPAIQSLQRSIGNAGVARLMRSTLARDVTVPVPGWGSELFGDDDSSVTFDPWTTFFLDGAFLPSAFDDMPSGQGRIAIKAGSKGTVMIKCKVHVFLDEKWNEDVYQDFGFSWKVAADLKGKLTFEQVGEFIGAPDDKEPGFAITSVKGSEGPSSLKTQVYMVSYQETDVPNVQIGAQGGKSDKFQVGGNITLGNETTQPAGTITPGPFVVEIEVTDIPPEPPPEPKVTIESVSVLREYPIYFEKENQDTVSGAEEGKFVKWWTKELPAEFREDITSGKVEVQLEGTASQTGGGQYNRRLAGRRVAAVEEVLRSFGVEKFKPRAPGEYDPTTGEERDEDKGLDRATREEARREMRKVTIKVWQEFKPTPDPGTGGGGGKPGGP